MYRQNLLSGKLTILYGASVVLPKSVMLSAVMCTALLEIAASCLQLPATSCTKGLIMKELAHSMKLTLFNMFSLMTDHWYCRIPAEGDVGA